jgi:hypothetical protein
MVNGLRHYPVANAVAQTFPHPVILNETGVPAALTKAAANDRGYNKERRFPAAVYLETATGRRRSLFSPLGYCSRKMIRAFVRS